MKQYVARPGELIIAKSPDLITSMALGSSLGICLYDDKNKVGGVVQSFYPHNPKNEDDCKYVDSAIRLLYQKMLDRGAEAKYLSAKLVGGARLFQLHIDGFQEDIGNHNVMSAYETLQALKIPIKNADVGDAFGRTFHFQLSDGIVLIETKQRITYHI